MARPKNYAKHINDAVTGLIRSVTTLVDEMRSSVPRSTVGSPAASSPTAASKGRRGPGKGNRKLKSKLRAYWANLTPAQRKARIAKMHAWRRKK